MRERGERVLDLVEQLLDRGRPFRFTVQGASMRPLLEEGDEVWVEPIGPDGPRPGDVVAYRQGGKVVAHVLHFAIGRGPRQRLFLKGIANRRGDWPIGQERILGRVSTVLRRGQPRRIEKIRIHPLSAIAWVPVMRAIAARGL